MSKYSNEFKLRVVKYCVEEHHGYTDAANHFNMREEHTVLKWVRKYQEHGEKGLIKKYKKCFFYHTHKIKLEKNSKNSSSFFTLKTKLEYTITR